MIVGCKARIDVLDNSVQVKIGCLEEQISFPNTPNTSEEMSDYNDGVNPKIILIEEDESKIIHLLQNLKLEQLFSLRSLVK